MGAERSSEQWLQASDDDEFYGSRALTMDAISNANTPNAWSLHKVQRHSSDVYDWLQS